LAKISKVSIALAALLALALLAGRLNPVFLEGVFSPGAVTSCAPLTSGYGLDRVLEWTALSLVAIMVCVMWAIIGQILGGTFGGQKYNVFIKGMLWGAVETAALLGLFTAMFSILWSYGMERLDTARAYAVLAKNTVQFDFGLMLSANFIAGFITNMNPQFKIPGPAYMTVGFQIAPMFKPFIDILGVTMQLITTAVVMWSAQEFLICFIKTNMLVILLPAGFFLRGFGLKAGGNALLAIALVLFFIYPHMIIMLGESVSGQLQDEITASMGDSQKPRHAWEHTCLDKPICCLANSEAGSNEPYILNGDSGQMLSVAKIIGGNFHMQIEDTGSGSGLGNFCMYNTFLSNAYRGFFIDSIMKKANLWTVAGGAGALIGTAALLKYMNISWMATLFMVPLGAFTLYAIMEMVFFVFIMSLIVPLFIVFITLTLAKEIAKVLGTEIDLSSLEKLI
jgi:hypothetical protein